MLNYLVYSCSKMLCPDFRLVAGKRDHVRPVLASLTSSGCRWIKQVLFCVESPECLVLYGLFFIMCMSLSLVLFILHIDVWSLRELYSSLLLPRRLCFCPRLFVVLFLCQQDNAKMTQQISTELGRMGHGPRKDPFNLEADLGQRADPFFERLSFTSFSTTMPAAHQGYLLISNMCVQFAAAWLNSRGLLDLG